MRAGFSQLAESTENDEAFEERMYLACESTVAYIVSKALDSALTFAQHAGRTRITSYDLVPALKYEGMVIYNDPDMLTEIQNIMANMNDDDENLDSSESESSEDEPEPEPPMSDITPNTCACNLCTNIRSAHRNWSRWNTTDGLQMAVQSSINRLCEDEMLEFPEM